MKGNIDGVNDQLAGFSYLLLKIKNHGAAQAESWLRRGSLECASIVAELWYSQLLNPARELSCDVMHDQ